MSDWFSSLSALATQASQLADQFTESIVASVDAASSELEKEQQQIRNEKQSTTTTTQGNLLPWETEDESKMILSQDLMEKIFALSLNEKNFSVTPVNVHAIDFNFTQFIPVIMKLKDIDANLARMHAKLSLKMNEETFWRNYHFRIMYLRASVGMDPAEPFQMNIYPENEIIFKASAPTSSSAPSSASPAASAAGAAGASSSASASAATKSSPTAAATPARPVSSSPSKDTNSAAANVSSSPAPLLTAAEFKLQQTAEKERQQQQRKQAEAQLAAAVEAELSEHETDYSRVSSLSSSTNNFNNSTSSSRRGYEPTITSKDSSSGGSGEIVDGSSSGVDVMQELADLDIELEGLEDDGDLDFDDLDDLDLDADAAEDD
jgi:hypothetical protein